MYDAGEEVLIQPTMLIMSVSSFLPFRVHENPFDPPRTFTPCQGSVFVHGRTVSSKGDSFPDEMSQRLLELERISVLSTVAVWRSVLKHLLGKENSLLWFLHPVRKFTKNKQNLFLKDFLPRRVGCLESPPAAGTPPHCPRSRAPGGVWLRLPWRMEEFAGLRGVQGPSSPPRVPSSVPLSVSADGIGPIYRHPLQREWLPRAEAVSGQESGKAKARELGKAGSWILLSWP